MKQILFAFSCLSMVMTIVLFGAAKDTTSFHISKLFDDGKVILSIVLKKDFPIDALYGAAPFPSEICCKVFETFRANGWATPGFRSVSKAWRQAFIFTVSEGNAICDLRAVDKRSWWQWWNSSVDNITFTEKNMAMFARLMREGLLQHNGSLFISKNAPSVNFYSDAGLHVFLASLREHESIKIIMNNFSAYEKSRVKAILGKSEKCKDIVITSYVSAPSFRCAYKLPPDNDWW